MTAAHDLARATLDLAEAVIIGAPPARLLELAERASRLSDAALEEEREADHHHGWSQTCVACSAPVCVVDGCENGSELSDGRWACSGDCFDAEADRAPLADAALDADRSLVAPRIALLAAVDRLRDATDAERARLRAIVESPGDDAAGRLLREEGDARTRTVHDVDDLARELLERYVR